jgi:hypothetical protein
VLSFNPFVVGSILAHPTKIQKTARRNVSRFSFLDTKQRFSFQHFANFKKSSGVQGSQNSAVSVILVGGPVQLYPKLIQLLS